MWARAQTLPPHCDGLVPRLDKGLGTRLLLQYLHNINNSYESLFHALSVLQGWNTSSSRAGVCGYGLQLGAHQLHGYKWSDMET